MNSLASRLTSPLSVFLIAFSLRLAYLWVASPDYAEWPDSRHIERIAWRLSQGQTYDDPTESPPAIYRAPLMPFVIAFIYHACGRHPRLAQHVLALLGALGAVALQKGAGRLFGGRAGGFIGLGAAGYPYFVYLAGTFYPEAIGVPLLSVCVLAFVVNIQRPDLAAREMAVLGALLGIGALCRPNWLLSLPLLIPAVFACRLVRRRSVKAFPFLAGALAWVGCWLPWTLRNAMTYDGIVFVTASGGYNFYLGNAPDATWTSKTAILKPHLAPGLGVVGEERVWYRLGWDCVRQNPSRAFRLWLGKLVAQWQPIPLIKDHAIPLVEMAIAGGSYAVLLVLALLGAILGVRRSRWEIIVLLGVAALDSCATAMFIAPARLRIPFDVFLALSAGSLLDVRKNEKAPEPC